MSILCELFGHKISNKRPWNRYFIAKGGAIDGIGRQHINLYCECDRCEERIKFGMIHGDEDGVIVPNKNKKSFSLKELTKIAKDCFYKGFEKSEKDDANCFTAWREEADNLINKK